MNTAVSDRIWNKIDKSGDCWNWTAALHGKGYGAVQFEGRIQNAHRVIWKLVNGPIPSGYEICHKCDNPRCCRPDHLFLGTSSENKADCIAKGRHARGERNGRSVLSQLIVSSIIADSRSQQDIAASFGINQSTVSRLKTRKRWKHLTQEKENRGA
jgi:hypothetical protein